MGHYETVCELIAIQQQGKENTAPWMVGEQLKEIARREPASAELLVNDLTVAEMSIEAAEKKIKAYADKHKKGNCAVVPPNVAEDILRKFYGLPKAGGEEAEEKAPGVINLADFL